jgi:hypothetical protein
LLASNFVCFVDNQWVTEEGVERIVEAGHALSSRESYLGLQNALRKIRYHEGTRQPGAWARACVVVEEEIGVAVLVSQEKWDKMKEICGHWLRILRSGSTALDYKQLQSNRGFMVYVTQAYPLFKQPYLKGFHLSLETWHGERDLEGWKVGSALKKDEVQAGQSDCQTTKNKEEKVPEESQEAFENQKVASSMDKFKTDWILRKQYLESKRPSFWVDCCHTALPTRPRCPRKARNPFCAGFEVTSVA